MMVRHTAGRILGAAGSCLCALLVATGPAAADGVIVAKSEIAFTTTQMGVAFDGHFRKWNASIVFTPGALATSRASIDVDLASIDLASSDSEAEARGPLWLETSRFPIAHFTSTSITSRGGDKYDVAGRLSLKGITRDCVVPIVVTRDSKGNRIAEGRFAVRRLDYRVGEGEWADTGTVANDIIVRIRMVLPPAA
ncbi:MAG: YceI family protein [Betaproteobacteria bacterium]|nr:YceI family protein [Betaproteobacteria bacterium]MDE2209034.1 YceI family protein [Betaproteobacteria bacterium]MDE2359054.1 YceI family protein [Betaproteobacteria bacterium]